MLSQREGPSPGPLIQNMVNIYGPAAGPLAVKLSCSQIPFYNSIAAKFLIIIVLPVLNYNSQIYFKYDLSLML